MSERLPTGIEVLDRKLNGGIPPGRIVVVSASPTSQSELLLYEIASARETVYLTAERTVEAVRDTLESVGTPQDQVTVRSVADDPLSEARDALSAAGEQTTVIVDPTLPLEQHETAEYRAFLNELKEHTTEHGSMAFLHCLDRRTLPANRDTTEYIADIIFDLSSDVRGDTLENRLVVPKFRGGQALEDLIKLNLTADVTIDISRKIA